MEDPGVGEVHGRRGPRGQPTNQYERRKECGCVDKEGAPAPLPDGDGGCCRCGYPINEGE